jgi:isoquinoline 1-oxidoreductase beta subunit
MNAPLKDGRAKSGPSRRQAISAMLSAAGGLAIGVTLPRGAFAAPAGGQPRPMGARIESPEAAHPDELSAWLVIDPDSSVTIRIPHNELGQGTSTALAMIVAEELHCDWSKVKCEYASANRNLREKGVYHSMTTVGSQGVRTSWEFLQQAGASGRGRLVEAAARRWRCDASECSCDNGVITHKATGRSLTYGQVCADAAAIKLDKEPKIKTPDQYRLVGKSTPRLDTPAKLDGSAKFGIDARVPGMVYAAVIGCPVPGGKVRSVDDSALKGRPGILQVVRMDGAVAVAADKFWRAKTAADDLKIEWDTGAAGKVDQAQLDQIYRDATLGKMVSARNDGDAAAALAKPGVKLVEALYEAPYQAHAPMEPLNATVWLQPDRLDVWVSTQSPPAVLMAAAEAAGIAPEKVFVHVNFVGGGFGRRSNPDETRQAVAVAKAVGRPVKLVWTREQDMLHDRYRPQAAARFKAALTPDGKADAMEVRIGVPSLQRSLGRDPVLSGMEGPAVECIAPTAYAIPNLSVGANLLNTHVPVSYCRGVGSSQNGFFIESFVDELAHAAGQDPYSFRRAHLNRADWIGVLDMMADKIGWTQPIAAGRGRGLAIMECYGTVTGQAAEVTVDAKGKVKVDRMVVVMDCYHAANPNTIHQQMEGGALFGLTQTLFGQITIKDGAAEQTNFHTYRPVRMAETPVIETYLHLSGGPKWGGIGEPGVGPTPPAICNAVFAATGKRVRRLPLASVDLTKL